MNRASLLLILTVASVPSLGQEFSVTFTGTGAANRIDSVKATNLTTNQSVTLPGNQTLVLTSSNGIPTVATSTDIGIVYPNPFPGKTTFIAASQLPQRVYVNITNLLGQVVAQTNALVQPGENEFALSIKNKGLYMVTLTTDQGTDGYKVICTETNESENRIEYLGSDTKNQNNQNISSVTELKTSQTTYTLGYTSGEIILYKCYSSIYTTVVTDTPLDSKNYVVEFAECTDPDGRKYSIVKIGYQTWMAENLAYLPAVSPPSGGKGYYVYGYGGTSVADAKATPNYASYGVLYDWKNAKADCPSGWCLPSDEDWKILEKYLGMSNSDADIWGAERNSGSVGSKLKEAGTSHWLFPNTGASNTSGFTALPGGYLYNDGPQNSWFSLLGVNAFFWSSLELTPTQASDRRLDFSYNGIQRYSFSDKGSGFSVRCIKIGPAPTASFTFSPPVGAPSTTFLFDASGCTDPETPTRDLEVRWDWNGDGNWDTRYDKTKTHSFQYPDPGNYSVILEVKDADGFVDTLAKMVIVGDGTLTDNRDGREYVFKNFGTQSWMLGNLAYLPSVSPSSTGSETSAYFYVYGYEGNNVTEAITTANYTTYGVLYNWEAAKTACPAGWHLPSDEEWKIFEKNQGMSNSDADAIIYRNSGSVGGKLKEIGTVHWKFPNKGAINTSGFTALPGGLRISSGSFGDIGSNSLFWSSSAYGSSSAWVRRLGNDFSDVNRSEEKRTYGFSVRCVRD
jgi:uncharacterized protein (TIGR02145 family)